MGWITKGKKQANPWKEEEGREEEGKRVPIPSLPLPSCPLSSSQMASTCQWREARNGRWEGWTIPISIPPPSLSLSTLINEYPLDIVAHSTSHYWFPIISSTKECVVYSIMGATVLFFSMDQLSSGSNISHHLISSRGLHFSSIMPSASHDTFIICQLFFSLLSPSSSFPLFNNLPSEIMLLEGKSNEREGRSSY